MIFREKRIRPAALPGTVPSPIADELRSRGFTLDVKRDPFFDGREKKSDDEVKKIRDSLAAAEAGLEAGIAAVKKSRIGRDRYLYLNGSRLTSETLKSIVNTTIMSRGLRLKH